VMKLSKVRMQSLISGSSIFSAHNVPSVLWCGGDASAVIEVFPSRTNKYSYVGEMR
jgi:hypothetical protein